jgi:hypothetical protein
MTARTFVLGDWGRVIRDPIDLLRASFFVGAAVFALTGELKGTGNLVVSGLVLLAARAVDLPRLYDLALTLAMILTGWGEALGLYDLISFYDNVVHFLVPLFCSQVAYIALARVEVLPDPRDDTSTPHHVGIFIVTLALGVAIGAIWEIFEWASDGTFGSKLQTGNEDTVGDLIADTLGSLTGGALLVAWTVYGCGSVRRIPGENRYEDTDA